jgi:cephalosporin hydroxylase
MRLIIDSCRRQLIQETEPGISAACEAERRVLPLYCPEAFRILSRYWLEVGWTQKYTYSFSWLGRPIVQLPEDVLRIQEMIYRVQPDVIIETGVAHGGSLVFYASLCKTMDRGRVIGIDIKIRPCNRAAIESHITAPLITLVEGSSIDPEVISQVRRQVALGETAIVLLDSCHRKDHVLAELEAYAPLVGVGSYLVAMDGIMEEIAGVPGSQSDWSWNNPKEAALEFVRRHAEFVIEEPVCIFNEGAVAERVTYWPSAFIKRVAHDRAAEVNPGDLRYPQNEGGS